MNRELAIQNSVTWYRAVLRAHGIPDELTTHYWSTDAPTPRYYSNLVTRTTGAGTTPQLERIRQLAAAPPAPVWSLKDSHGALDTAALSALGLRVLFDASWYALAPRDVERGGYETGARFTAVTDPDELRRWEAAWQVSSPAPDQVTFPNALLDDPDITFLAAVRGGDPVGGAIANASDGAVGLSNAFVLDPTLALPLQRDLARAAGDLHPQRPVVGYGRAVDLETLAPLGAVDLGALRVWISA